jgi:glutamate-1-semialdehyde 2,1-aminomutase
LWQFTVSATDANRHVIRYSRLITKRKKIIVIDRCYHGSVDESFATLDNQGNTVARTFEEHPEIRYGLTTMCIGLGMGGTVIWENPNWNFSKQDNAKGGK